MRGAALPTRPVRASATAAGIPSRLTNRRRIRRPSAARHGALLGCVGLHADGRVGRCRGRPRADEPRLRQGGEIVSRYGGRIDKLMGDAVLAVFGDPVVHEDDAVRAVRAALELHTAVNDCGPPSRLGPGTPSRCTAASTAGSSSRVTCRETGRSGPLGDMVNVAARLQSLASAGEIYIGPETPVARRGPVRADRPRRPRAEGSARARSRDAGRRLARGADASVAPI